MIKIAVSGFGTVGQGVAEVLLRRKDFLTARYGEMPQVVLAMDSKTYAADPKGLDLQGLIDRKKETGSVGKTKYSDSAEVLSGTDYDILIEVTPTDIKTGGAGLVNITRAWSPGRT
ncbi:hypothetical protein [Candidatus Methanomethylophilus sp. 1R26]|uniref:hypothetical protein n=1 Tax=Candidatus Methanomethylophilus sp. 1R26 TaxID=1769296 RepID=UPI000AF3BD31|nr:hypothetical protein [Candidatus Methanomethylophilus sp. 1R26]